MQDIRAELGGLPNNQHFTPRFFEEKMLLAQNSFRSEFKSKHQALKAQVHLCQHKAYTDGLEFDKAEEQAQLCILPLLLVRRHASTLMQNKHFDYSNCMKNEQQNYDTGVGQMTKDQL